MPRKKRTIPDALGRQMPLTRRGFGTMRQLPSGNWQASYVGPDGKRYKAPHTFLTRDAGETWLALENENIKTGKWAAAVDAIPFSEYATNWLATHRRKDGKELAPKTKINYQTWVGQLIEHLEDTPLNKITPTHLRKIHASATKTNGATTAARQMQCASTIFNVAVKDGLIPKNPVPSELYRTSTGRKMRPPTDAELAIILDNLPPAMELAASIEAYAGLRIGEWRALTRADLAKDGNYWVIDVNKQAIQIDGEWLITDPKSDTGFRKQALPTFLNPKIEAHLQTIGPEPDAKLFPGSNGGGYVDTEWKRAWTKARQKAGVQGEVRGHDLRHYYATTLARAGASAPLLQAALGHADITMSMKYVEKSRTANTSLADLIKPAS